jgi:uncharacterized delta-60 repeat protein
MSIRFFSSLYKPLSAMLRGLLCLSLLVYTVCGQVHAQTHDTSFNPDLRLIADEFAAMALQPDGKIIIAGAAQREGFRLIRLNVDGSADSAFNINAPTGLWAVTTMVVLGNGQILLAGDLNNTDDTARFIMRLNADGTRDASFNASAVTSRVNALVEHTDGTLWAALETQRDTDCALIHLSRDGVQDTGFCLRGNGARVTSLIPQVDGRILIVSAFRPMALRRLNADGVLDTTFNACFQEGRLGDVDFTSAVTVQADGKILLGAHSSARNQTTIIRLWPDGSVDTSFSSSTAAFAGTISQILLQANGSMLIAGDFSGAANGLARLNANGMLDTAFHLDRHLPERNTYKILLQADGRILLATTRPEPHYTAYLARFLNETASQSLVLNASELIWRREGALPELSRVSFEQSNDGVSYAPLGQGSRIEATSDWRLQLTESLPINAHIRVRGRYTASNPDTNASSLVELVGRRTEGRTLCSDPRIGVPCRRIAVRVLRYRRDPVRLHDALVYVTDQKGRTQVLSADKLGDYVLDDAEVGSNYQFYIKHPSFVFKAEMVNVTVDMQELEFVALDGSVKQ